jgi:exodeoxyribonuclease VII large subunit
MSHVGMPSQRAGDRPVLTVSEVTELVRLALEAEIPPVAVEGEISNLRRPASGHLYFTLKDAASQLRCVFFRALASRLSFEPRDGMKVVAWGRITVYAPRGEYQLKVERLQRSGLGELAQAFLELKERLAAEGLFDAARKRPLPRYPRVVGLVTSATGAAVRDMVRILRRRWPPVRIVLRPTRVQGEGAAEEIARALEAMGAWGGADVVIVGRGGGSLEDLWAFNEEVLARAIARSPIPVVSAVGHEIDVTIADFAADVRAPTPSAAAELVVPEVGTVRRHLAELDRRLTRTVAQRLRDARTRLGALAASRALGRPQDLMDQTRQRLDELLERMGAALRRLGQRRGEALGETARRLEAASPVRRLGILRERLAPWRQRLETGIARRLEILREALRGRSAQLEALGPRGVLERGFCIALDPAGRPVRAPRQAPPGTLLRLLLAEGRLRARSEGADEGGEDR